MWTWYTESKAYIHPHTNEQNTACNYTYQNRNYIFRGAMYRECLLLVNGCS